MTTLKERLSEQLDNYRELFKKNSQRFLWPMIFSLLLWVLSAYIIWWPEVLKDEWLTEFSLALGLTINYSIALQLALERTQLDKIPKGRWLQSTNLVVLGIAYNLKDWLQPLMYYTVAMAGLNILLLFLAYYFLLSQTNRKNIFPYVVGKMFFAGFACLLSMAGISLCLGAFKMLIFTGLEYKCFAVGYSFAALVVGFNAFVMQMPRYDETITTPQFCKNLVMKIVLATYLFLIMVLYLYIGKIFTYGKMPEGTMNWYASIALLFFLFFTWCLEDVEKNTIVKIFVKYGGYVMIPIVLVQIWGVWIRYQAYGVTTLRYVSMTCSIFGILAMGYTVLHKYNRNIFLVGAGLAVLITMTPLNCIDIPFREQWGRVETIVQKHNLLKDGKIVKATEGLTDREQEVMTSALNYLDKSSSSLRKSGEVKILLDKETRKKWGLKDKKQWQPWVRVYSTNIVTTDGINVKGYSKVYKFTGSVVDRKTQNIKINITTEKGTETKVYKVAPYIEALRTRALVIEEENRKVRDANKVNSVNQTLAAVSSYGKVPEKKLKENLEYQIDSQTKVVFSEISFVDIDDEKNYYWLGEGYVLVK